MLKNIMSVDLEDYFCDLPFEQWDKYPERVTVITKHILELFDKYNVKATFFTLGYIGEKHPELIELIVSKGHEIASHGNHHLDARKISQQEFELDISSSIQILSKISGEKILGFRAPFFSINKDNLWVFDILQKHLAYDSSIFPVRTPLYGISTALRYPYTISKTNPLKKDPDNNFLEIPPSTLHLPIFGNVPIAGGFYLRFLPISLIKHGIKKINKNGFSAMIYIHPKDLDPEMPSISEYSWHYYWGLKKATSKFESLLKNFKFSSVRDVFIE